MDEQLKLAHKVVNVVDRINRKNCVTLLRDNVDKPESSYAKVRLSARNKEDEKFQQVVYVIYKLGDFIYLLDVMHSVYDKVITNPHLKSFKKINFTILLFIIIFFSSHDELEHWR